MIRRLLSQIHNNQIYHSLVQEQHRQQHNDQNNQQPQQQLNQQPQQQLHSQVILSSPPTTATSHQLKFLRHLA